MKNVGVNGNNFTGSAKFKKLQNRFNKLTHEMIAGGLMSWITHKVFIVIVSEVPFNEDLFVRKLCALRNFLNDFEHFYCNLKIGEFGLVDEFDSFNSSEIASR